MKPRNLFIATIILCSMAIPARAQKSERGVAHIGKDAPVAVAKGTVMFGGSVRGSYFKGNNYSLAVIDGLNPDGYTMKIKPTVMYVVADNVGIGVRGSYNRGYFSLPHAGVTFNSIDIKVDDVLSLKQSYGGSVFARYFIPLGYTGRFSIIGDLVVGGEAGTAKFSKRGKTTGSETEMLGTYQKDWKFGAHVEFGMMAFFTRHFALEAELGILGCGISGSKSVKNQVYEGSYKYLNPYFDINFLSLSVGAFLYF